MTNARCRERKGSEMFLKVIGYVKLIKLVLASAYFLQQEMLEHPTYSLCCSKTLGDRWGQWNRCHVSLELLILFNTMKYNRTAAGLTPRKSECHFHGAKDKSGAIDLVWCAQWKNTHGAFITQLRTSALTGVAQGVGLCPSNWKVTGLIPSLGHMPGLQARSLAGGVQEATNDVSLFLFPLPSPLYKINK